MSNDKDIYIQSSHILRIHQYESLQKNTSKCTLTKVMTNYIES